MPARLPPNWPPYDERRIIKIIDALCVTTSGARMKDCLLAHAVLVSNILDHYPGGRAAGIRQFNRLLEDCPTSDVGVVSTTSVVPKVQ